MAKWNIHRPAKRASTTPLVFPTSSNSRKPSTGRRVFHLHQPHVEQGPWTCAYGCKPFVWQEGSRSVRYHAWHCAYWHNEGRTLSPF